MDNKKIRKHPLAHCENCPWREEGAYVPSLIPKGNIKVAVVGEAPGAYEAKTGIPFTGPSGELLDRVMQHHGFERKDLALINTVACRPHGPTEKPPKGAIAACRPRLEADLRRADAPQILAVGGTSAKEILGDSAPISKLRIGLARQSRFGPVVATWHPAFCLRTPDSFPSFVRDTGKLIGQVAEPWVPPTYKVFNDPVTALVAIRRLYSVKRIVLDIEAASDKDIDDSHPEDYDLLCIGIAYAKGQVVVFGDKVFKDPACVDAFGTLLRLVQVDGWNVKFDLLGMSPLFGLLKAHADGMLMSYTLDERPRQHGLKQRLVEDQNAPRYDDEIAQYTKGKGGSFANIPKDLLYKYNAYDCGGTWDEMEYLDMLMGPQQHKLHKFLIDAVNMLMHVEMSPLHFDLSWNGELEDIYKKKIDDSQRDIESHVGHDFNPRSWVQIMKYFASKGMTIPTTNRDFLEKIHPLCSPEIQKFIDLILINRNLAKAYGTYVKGLRKKVKDGKINTTFSLHSTTSGRTASRKPNLQNVKRDKPIRNQFTAEPPSEENPDGKILVQCDYSQAEGRTIADLARDAYLQKVFSDPDVDIFNDMCNRIWGSGAWNKENRVSIKSIFYGYSYGRKAKSIARELDKPVEYAVELMNEFKALIPDVVAWQAAIRHEVLEKQELWTPFGRKRSFHLITNENLEDVINEALSFKPQSIASDICLRAAVSLQPKLKEQFDADIKLLIHDAIVTECRPQDREAVVELMRQEMVYSGRLYTEFVPFKVDASWGFRLGEL